jgi:hypothetical protein
MLPERRLPSASVEMVGKRKPGGVEIRGRDLILE